MAEKVLPQLEVEVGQTPQESTNDVLEGAAERPLSGDTQEEFGLLPSENQEENLECVANELQEQDEREEEEAHQDGQNGAVEGHEDSNGQVTPSPQTPRPGSPDGGYLEEDSCYLTDSEDFLQDSGSSTGYYPCYQTYSQLPPLQLEDTDDLPKRPDTGDASIQVGGTCQDKACDQEGGVEATPRGEEAKTEPDPAIRSLPPSPEEALRTDGKDQAATQEEQTPSAPSSLEANPPSRRGVNQFVRWIRNIFCQPSPPRPPPSPRPVGERRRRHIIIRIRGWIRKHRGHVHPHPC